MIRSTTPYYGVLVNYFKLPNVVREQYDSWIAQILPSAIVFQAAAIVFTTNGNEDKANQYAKYVQQTLDSELTASFLTTVAN